MVLVNQLLGVTLLLAAGHFTATRAEPAPSCLLQRQKHTAANVKLDATNSQKPFASNSTLADARSLPAASAKSLTQTTLLQSNAEASADSKQTSVQPTALKADRSTLFYHFHIPRTGGTTIASLLVADVCSPGLNTNTALLDGTNQINLRYDGTNLCTLPCELGLTDNELSCASPDRLHFEHQMFSQNYKRSEDLMASTGAQKTIFVTTLRRGSDRLKSQWALEVVQDNNSLWIPPPGVEKLSNESLQLYLWGGHHTGDGWEWTRKNPSQNNNLQVAQLASIDPESPEVVTRAHLELAKQVLMTGDWLIGFTKCLDKVHEKITTYTKALHGTIPETVMPRELGDEAAADVGMNMDAETTAFLDSQCAFDNELFDWAWALAEANADERFAETC